MDGQGMSQRKNITKTNESKSGTTKEVNLLVSKTSWEHDRGARYCEEEGSIEE